MADIEHKDLSGADLHPPGPHTHNAAADLTGIVPIANLATGTPTGSKFVRDDGTLAVPAGGSVPLLSLRDHFAAGASTSGVVGELGWAVNSGGSMSRAYLAGELGHPGILQQTTGSTISQYGVLYLQNTSVGPILPAEMFDSAWEIRLPVTDANILVRAGMGANATANPPLNGIYFEKLAADTDWFGVTRAAGSQTRTASLGATNTSLVTLRVRRVDPSTVAFSVNGGAEVNATLTIPTAALNPFTALSNASAANKALDHDLFTLSLA